ncbi:GNAT family N-acetyltransferase [Pseudomonas piscis]|uniref:GNAT family N-acetyltransferase n=1 Tax=Pseudomonas piscis TaxID=2614538 RepID=UPI0021D58AA1|nr:GNAT family N-acetyltransferase [Pseudomonas piscis]MCU7645637.1 GNAT family N-acetyltransferase [Pseudomonas piscis]
MQSLPIPQSIVGESLELRPLEATDFDSLYSVASDPLVWAQHPSPMRYQESVFREWFKEALASQCALVVLDRSNNQVIGSSRYYEFDEEKREVAIGYTFLARAKWGGGTNKELKDMMLTYAFQLVDTVWFHVDSQNIRSQRAMEKIGGRLSHRATRQLIDRTQEYLLYKVEKPSRSE